jgi:hypothetical protein
MPFFQSDGQGLKQLAELGAAFVLSALVGLEREVRHKSAGLRYRAPMGRRREDHSALITLLETSGKPRSRHCSLSF